MTTMTAGGRVPEFTMGWRMRLALETSETSVQDMADRLGYSRSTISRWLNDQDEPRAAIKAQWCLLTGVSLDWLETGQDGSGPTPPDRPGGKPVDKLAALTAQKRQRSASRRRATPQYLVGSPAAA